MWCDMRGQAVELALVCSAGLLSWMVLFSVLRLRSKTQECGSILMQEAVPSRCLHQGNCVADGAVDGQGVVIGDAGLVEQAGGGRVGFDDYAALRAGGNLGGDHEAVFVHRVRTDPTVGVDSRAFEVVSGE